MVNRLATCRCSAISISIYIYIFEHKSITQPGANFLLVAKGYQTMPCMVQFVTVPIKFQLTVEEHVMLHKRSGLVV